MTRAQRHAAASDNFDRRLATLAAMLSWLLSLVCSSSLAAQTPPPAQPVPPAPAAVPRPSATAPAGAEIAAPRTPAERALARAVTDLRAADEHLRGAPHEFAGAIRCYGPESADAAQTLPFRGHERTDLLLHRLGEYVVVTSGQHVQRVHRDGRWRKPDGDAPDCPLSPRALLQALADAEIVRSDAAAHDERPAQRVHAVWRGAARKTLLAAFTAPSSQLDTRLHHVAGDLEAIGEALIVDAVLYYDPARKRLLAATVRIAVFDPTAPIPGDPPTPPPGLPPLATRPPLALECDLTMTAAPSEPWPEIDEAVRRELLPRPSAPSATPSPTPPESSTPTPAKLTPR